MQSTSNINKNQELCLTDFFKLLIACSSLRILKHRLIHIFDCHLLRIFESSQCTSKIPTFTLLLMTNAQLHLKMLSCNFYFLKNLTDFRHVILQLVTKFKIYFMEGVFQIKHFFPSSISLLPNLTFLLLSFIFRFFNNLGKHNLQKEVW